ncbi:NepR family anti-sigma factor [uncultured Roseobacter sp.]|uniref:NepR family anti-sigma factor n=1 Tax=uncultured Roseobacter sp. TaxID=114847 RepID=UPI002604D136|nr:NepR family anti-sigma factor [uncultured Roseobacter sp.]
MSRDDQNNRTSEMIDENLRKIFRQDADSDLPDRFTALLDKLRAQDLGGNNKGDTRR